MFGEYVFQKFMFIVFLGVLKEYVYDLIEINVNIKDFCERCGYKMGFVKDLDINRYLGDDDEFFVYVNIIFEENF